MDTLDLTYETFRNDIVVVWLGRSMLILLGLVITTFITMTAKNVYLLIHNWVRTLSALPSQLNELIKQLSKLNTTFNKHREDFNKHTEDDEEWKEKVEDKLMKVEEEMTMKDDWWGRKFDRINSEVKTNKTVTDAQHASMKGKVTNLSKDVKEANQLVRDIRIHHNFNHPNNPIS